jgi:hypothetical protein
VAMPKIKIRFAECGDATRPPLVSTRRHFP